MECMLRLCQRKWRHADQVIVGEGESVILDVVEGRPTDKIIRAPVRKIWMRPRSRIIPF